MAARSTRAPWLTSVIVVVIELDAGREHRAVGLRRAAELDTPSIPEVLHWPSRYVVAGDVRTSRPRRLKETIGHDPLTPAMAPASSTLCPTSPACVTVTVRAAIASVPVRPLVDAFAATEKRTSPGPLPLTPCVTTIQSTFVSALHAHLSPVLTRTVSVPPTAPTDTVVLESV